MEINYTTVVMNTVESKLAYHGFMYNEDKSSPERGSYEFTRIYWGKPQSITISRVAFDREAVKAGLPDPDDPLEQVGVIPGYRVWLSNRYINAYLGSISVSQYGLGYDPYEAVRRLQLPFEEFGQEISQEMREAEKQHIWWGFKNKGELVLVLRRIVDVILSEGLDWFDEQVAEIRRHHVKLDERRMKEKMKKKSQNRKADY